MKKRSKRYKYKVSGNIVIYLVLLLVLPITIFIFQQKRDYSLHVKAQSSNSGQLLSPNIRIVDHQDQISISGPRIVWADVRTDAPGIYMYDLINKTESRISSSSAVLPNNPWISGHRVIWIDRRNGVNDIYLYDISTKTETLIPTNAGNPTNNNVPWPPASISGTKVVWNSGNQFYLYDLSTGSESSIPLQTDGLRVINPVIFGNKISGTILKPSDNKMFIYDLKSGVQRNFVRRFTGAYPMAMTHDRMAWVEFIHTQVPNSLQMYDWTSNKEYWINENTPFAHVLSPTISGNRMVWQDARHTAAGEIYMCTFDSATGNCTEQRLTENSGIKYSTGISGDNIIWLEYSNLITQIYLLPKGFFPDSDKDGFSDELEKFMGTDPNNKCATSRQHHAWPIDTNNDSYINGGDISKLIPMMNSGFGDSVFNVRYDLNMDGWINEDDMEPIRIAFLSACN